MNDPIVIFLFIFPLIVILYFIFVKGHKKSILLTNSKDTEIAVSVEIADSMATRAKGLMGRKHLGENEGMLFVFDKPDFPGIWMLNVDIPLDAIFISGDGTIVDVIEMEPCGLDVLNCKLYLPKEKAKYVLEVNKGFSKENKIVPGKSKAKLTLSSLSNP